MWGLWLVVGLTAWFSVWVSIWHVHQHHVTPSHVGLHAPRSGFRLVMGACRNSILGVFGIFLAKNLFQSSKFSEGIFFTWPLFSG
jgi:hypothetical protein